MMVPEQLIDRLRRRHRYAEGYSAVSVLFVSLVLEPAGGGGSGGSTGPGGRSASADVLDLINTVFVRLDELCAECGVLHAPVCQPVCLECAINPSLPGEDVCGGCLLDLTLD